VIYLVWVQAHQLIKSESLECGTANDALVDRTKPMPAEADPEASLALPSQRSNSNPRSRQYTDSNKKRNSSGSATSVDSAAPALILPLLRPIKAQTTAKTNMPSSSRNAISNAAPAPTVPAQAKESAPQQTDPSHSSVEVTSTEKESLKKILMTTKLFSGLNKSQLERVLEACSIDWAVPGQLITKEGDDWPYFCAIITGKVQVSRSDKGILGKMEAGKWFGHFRRSAVAMATVLSIEKTLISRISSHDFDLACRPNPDDEGAWSRNSKPPDSSDPSSGITQNISSLYDNLSIDSLKFDTQMIGSGTFAQVFRCQTQDGQVHAIKCISKTVVVKHGAEKQMSNEVALLSILSHQFIVHLDKVLQDRHCIYLLMEFVPGGEFMKYLQAKRTISDAEAQFYVVNVALGLEFMHSKNIIFRDLKPENLVFSADGYLKMVDLGFAKQISGSKTFTLCGTPDYISPEIVANKGHGKPVDFWSLGILLYEMLTATTPYFDAAGNVYKIYEQIMNKKLMFPIRPRLSSEVRSCISSLLMSDPKKRLEGNDLRNHHWVKYTDWAGVCGRRVQAPHTPEGNDSLDLDCPTSYNDLVASMTHAKICDIWNPIC